MTLAECERDHPKGYFEPEWPKVIRSMTQHQRDMVLGSPEINKPRRRD